MRPAFGIGSGTPYEAATWENNVAATLASSLTGTPSPGPPRLKKTPAAVHPLPQGGEGRGSEGGIVSNQAEQDTRLHWGQP